jgi:acrylyl-CoA reductase (NADPH)
MTFQAMVLEQADKAVTGEIRALDEEVLPDGDVVVDVAFSDLNYKDGLILKGKARLVRDYPHVPGIDLAGVVASSRSAAFKPGDRVVLTGWGLGERHWGGFAQKARVKSDWLVRLPNGLTERQAMAIGTAGFTAMISVMALEHAGLHKDGGPILVTGATGGVGSVAIALLAAAGYEVAAATGKAVEHDYLHSLGATEIVDRAEFADPSERPLEPARWNGGVDTVGGTTLARALAQMKPHTAVAVCGNAGGNELSTTVLPCILRGVSILGIDSVYYPAADRQAAWDRLARDLPLDKLDAMTTVIPLGDLPAAADQILKGLNRGRTVVDVNA